MSSSEMLDPWSAGYLGATLLMWSIMMTAMMLPSTLPTVRRFASASRRAAGGHASTERVALFIAGYLSVWIAFSAAATILQALLHDRRLLAPDSSLVHPWIGSGVLFLAGVYQLTPWKGACLAHCQSPLAFLLHHWRAGRAGAAEMGLRHGLYCMGCCWALMLVLFAVGVMNMAWVVALAVVILLEKVALRGPWLSRLAGAALIAWAVLRLSA